jgi:amino acid adenylation domain-containing protein
MAALQSEQPDLANDPVYSAIAFDRAEFDQSIVTRFAKVAAQFASKTAICGNGEQWTYQELDRRTNQIARAIVERTRSGAGCVAYLVRHSPNMVICALGALKAGKAFLCLYPALPLAALRDIVRDAAPDLLLTDAAHEPVARDIAGGDPPIIRLDCIDARYALYALRSALTAKDPAAIFYTSGSTGRPKGVVKSHRAVMHRAWLCAQYEAISTTDRQSLLTYCSFASSEADCFGALLNGAALELFDVASHGFIELRTWIDARRITLLHPPVVLFRRYLSTLDGSGLHPSVRLLALAGEKVTASDIQQWRQRFATSCALRHRFSSTEAGHIAVASVEPGELPEVDTVPAPVAVADKFLSVIDGHGNPVATGETGELVVRSAFLADGYWRRIEESAKRFPTDPNDPQQRLFHTGDQVRLLDVGKFDFVSRRDNQVKIRGHRVETGEIELAFVTAQGVKEAAVIVDSRLAANVLIAFVVMEQGELFQPEVLRSGLRSILPQWKIPAYIYPIESLPLTPNGKVDRQRLREHSRAKR